MTFNSSGSVYLPGFAGRSTSFGSCSVSGSCSGSHAPSGQMPIFQQGSSNPYTFTGWNMSSMLQDHLIEELGIDVFFTDHTKTGLRFCWGWYLEVVKAIDQAHSTSEAGNWPLDLPAFNEVLIIEVFIGKSAWHNQKSHFSAIRKHYPDMVSWLNQDITDKDEDREAWGDYWDRYTLEDLKEYLDLGGRLKRQRTQSRPHSPPVEATKGKGRAHKKK